jgi:hypothetical protein
LCYLSSKTDSRMKRLVPIVLVAASLLLGIGPAVGQSRWAISLSAAPVYTGTNTESSIVFGVTPPTILNVSNRASDWGYSVGLLARYNISPRWSASTGLWATNWLSSHYDVGQNGQSFNIDFTNEHPFEFWYKIPLLVNYQPSTGRLCHLRFSRQELR